MQQHQIVYEALKAEMGGKLHALALQTGTPEALMRGRDARLSLSVACGDRAAAAQSPTA